MEYVLTQFWHVFNTTDKRLWAIIIVLWIASAMQGGKNRAKYKSWDKIRSRQRRRGKRK